MKLLPKLKDRFTGRKFLQTQILLDSRDNAYVPGDIVSGSVKFDALCDLELTKANIKLSGSVFVEIQRAGVGSAPSITVTSERQNFLEMRLDLFDLQEPTAKFLSRDTYRSFPFEFMIPLCINQACNHQLDNDKVREKHHLLPPHFSLRGPEKVKIRYCLEFDGDVKLLHAVSTIKTVASHSIVISPTPWARSVDRKSYFIMKEPNIVGRFGKLNLGKIKILAHQPSPILIDAHNSRSPLSEITSVKLALRLTLEHGFSFPRLRRLKRNFTSTTFLSTLPWNGFPVKFPGLALSTNRGVRLDRSKLSKLKLAPMNWERVEQNSENTDTHDQSVYVCRLDIPIVVPIEKEWIPTFYSCFVAREYAANLELEFHSREVGNLSVSLNVPIDVVCVDRRVEVFEHIPR